MGRHKPAIRVGGIPVVARILEAAGDLPTVVVGSAEGAPEGTTVVREDPPGGGPVAGIAAGFAALDARLGVHPDAVAVLAGDLPLLTRAGLEGLFEALREDPTLDVVVTLGPDGEPNWLCSAWRATALRERLDALGTPAGRSVRSLLGDARRGTLVDESGWSTDVDTPEDLERARAASALRQGPATRE